MKLKDTKLIFGYVIQILILYKMVKKILKKNVNPRVNMILTLVDVFDDFMIGLNETDIIFNKIHSYILDFIIRHYTIFYMSQKCTLKPIF